MSTTDGDVDPETPSTPPEDVEVDRRSTVRVARLLRWYPSDWRDRYGDEFESVLSCSLRDGKGGLRLSVDVAREGMATRLEGAGFLGRVAPPLKRARASIVTIFVATVGFLVSAAVLAHYTQGWRGYPVALSVDKVNQAEIRFARHAPSSAQQTAFLHELKDAYAHTASGAPVVFDRITHIAVAVAVACLAVVLGIAVVARVRALRSGSRGGLLAPASVLLAAGFEYAHFSGPTGGPPSGWTALKLVLVNGQFELWRQVIFPLCTAGTMVIVVIGIVKLIRRVEFGPRLCRLQGGLAVVAAGSLAVAVISTLTWAATLYGEAPGFLIWTNEGVLGTPLLPLFILALVVMVGACSLVAVGCTRCLRSVR